MLNLVHPSVLHQNQHFTLFYTLLLLLVFSSGLVTVKPGCPPRCGNLTIPFPFGVGSGCYLDPSFDLICNTSTDHPKAYLSMNGSEVEVIEIYPSQIRVNYPYLLARACYNSTSSNLTTINEWFTSSLSGTQYTFSGENWITAIGCDDLVLGLGESNETFGSSCVSYCRNGTDQRGDGFCPEDANAEDANVFSAGKGCCRTPIPRGMVILGALLTDLDGTWRSERLFPCSYAFIQERGIGNQSQFRYPLSYLNDSTAFANYDDDSFYWKTSEPLMVRLDWRIGAENCSQARRNSTAYACRENSDCVDYFDGSIGGYLCNCSQGYKGNPYLLCQDIDECDDSTRTYPCASNSICKNLPGSFTCSCREGYFGDGIKNGTGCIRLPHSKKLINILTGLGSGLGFLLLLAICFWLHKELQKRKNKKRKEKFFKRNGGLLLQQQANEGSIGKTELFSAKALETATDHFNESRILGKGGQGTVYKGMLSDGKIVAIKKSKLVDENLLEQFINEVVLLSQINHRNVVKLLGCCLETEVPMLVYEFLPNGTLFDLIHDPNVEFPFTWNICLKMATDIAGALAYLHSASSVPIYHRDIKSSNILLDEKYVVKVSDFGTSSSVAVDQTHLTTMVKGTFGYLDPEYFQSSHFTEKSDVYSFGVVLVELLTRQRPISLNRSEKERSLATRFIASMEANNLDGILDAQVSREGRKEEVIAVAKLAQRCLNFKGKMRPTMKEVATELESIRISQMSSTIENEETRAYEAKAVMISDNEYTWTTSTSGSNAASSSSDTRPLIFEIA